MISWVSRVIIVISLIGSLGQAALSELYARLEPADGANVDIDKLNWKSIPTNSKPTVYLKQVFTLYFPGQEDLTILPVEYTNNFTRCGVYFLPKQGPYVFVPVVGEAIYSWNCSGIEAVGEAADAGPHPRLIFIFTAYCGHDYPDNPTPFILSWNEKKGAYQLDEPQTQWVFDQDAPSSTVARVRRLLARYPNTPKEQHGPAIQ